MPGFQRSQAITLRQGASEFTSLLTFEMAPAILTLHGGYNGVPHCETSEGG
jgi:hypothetical protein